MKRLFLLFYSLFIGLSLCAQIEIVKDGKVIKDGDTIEFYATEENFGTIEDPFYFVTCSPTEPMIVNKGDKSADVSVEIVKDNENDQFSWCMLGVCRPVVSKSTKLSFSLNGGSEEGLNLHAEGFEYGMHKTLSAHVIVCCGDLQIKFRICYKYGNKNILTIKVNDLSRLYGDDNPIFGLSYSGFIDGDNAQYLSQLPMVKTSATKESKVGKYKLSVDGAEDKTGKYEFQYVSGVLSIEQAPLKIMMNNDTITYGDTFPKLDISRLEFEGLKNNELTPVWITQPTYIVGENYQMAVGQYELSLEGSLENYKIDKIEKGMLIIEPATILVKADDKRRLYCDSIISLSCSYDGLKNGDSEDSFSKRPILETNAKDNSDVGCYEIKVSGAEADNYIFTYENGVYTIEKRPLTISVADYEKNYGDENPQMKIQYEGFVNNEDESVFSIKPMVLVDANVTSDVGSYNLKLSDSETKNYSLQEKYLGKLTVKPADLLIIPEDTTKIYFEENPILTCKYSGFKNNETEEILEVKPKAETLATKTSDVGIYQITVSGGVAKNYRMIYATGKLLIKKRSLIVNVDDFSRIYGDEATAIAPRYIGFVNNENEDVLDSRPQVRSLVNKESPVGIYNLVLEGGSDNNYDIKYGEVGNLTIVPATLVVRAQNVERLYFEDSPVLKIVYEGFKNGEDESILKSKAQIRTSVTKGSVVGAYSIEPYGAESSNYVFNYLSGIYSIRKRPLFVRTSNYEKNYGEKNPVVNLIYDGFVNNETEDVIREYPRIVLPNETTTDAGIYNIIIEGGDVENYYFVYEPGSLTIKKADQHIEWNQSFDYIEVGNQVVLNAKSSSGLSIEYLVSDPTVADVYMVGEQFILDCFKDGEVVIRASQAGDNNYNAAMRVSKMIRIVPTGIEQTGCNVSTSFVLKDKCIYFPHNCNFDHVIVYSMNGRKVYEGKPQRIALTPGAFLLRIDDQSFKVMIK